MVNEILELGKALRERGFDARFQVILPEDGPLLSVDPERLIDCSYTVNSSTSTYRTSSPETAVYLVELYTATGTQVWFRLGEARLHAYAPDDETRGDQRIERLRVDGSQLWFERRVAGDWELVSEVELANHHELLAAIDERRHAWAARGLLEIADEAGIHRDLADREFTLEQRLRECEAHERAQESAVYADWLLARGDPRGMIGMVAIARDQAQTGPERERLQGELDRLEREHVVHLFGMAFDLVEFAVGRWDGPTWASLAITDYRFAQKTREALLELLATPPCACLRELAVSVGDIGLENLAATSCAPGLRRLQVKANDFVLMTDAFGRLETLEIDVERFHFGPARLPMLRRLDLRTSWVGELLERVSDFDTPLLEHFGFEFSSRNPGVSPRGSLAAQLITMLHEPGFARLRSLRYATQPDTIELGRGFAEGLLALPAFASLERIDLRGAALAPRCRRELLSHDKLRPKLLLA
jgi:hypothetical protein